MIRIAIVEDDVSCAQQLLGYIRRYSGERGVRIETSLFPNGLEFISEYTAGYEIVLMDIEMPHLNGLETARKLRQMDQQVCLIFVTNMAQYAINGYEVQALDFMVKPVGYFNLTMKLDRAISICKKAGQVNLLIPTERGMRKVSADDVVYVESEKHYLYIHLEAEVHKIRSTMGELMEKLPADRFACCNKSYCVNLGFVSGFGSNDVTVNGRELSISRSYRKEFIDRLTTFFNRGGN